MRASRYDIAVVSILIMAWMFVFGMISTGLLGPNRSSIEQEYKLSHTVFGTGVGLIQLVCAVGVLLIVPLLRHFRNANALIVSLAAQVFGFAAISLTRSVHALIIGWTLITLGIILGSITNTISASLWPDNPRRGVVLLHGFNGLGKVAGPLVAALCLMLGWRWSFGAVGLITALMFFAFLAFRRRFEHISTARGREVRTQILRKPFYWLCVLPFVLITGGEHAFFSLMPLFYEQQYSLSPEKASLLMTVHLMGLAAGRFAVAPLGNHISNNRIIGICLLSGLFVIPALLINNIVVWIVCLFIAGGVFSGIWPVFYNQASKFLMGYTEMLDYGSALGNILGISIFIYISSRISDVNLTVATFFGIMVTFAFGFFYYLSPLSKEGKPITVESGWNR